jgi:hypothetical protein
MQVPVARIIIEFLKKVFLAFSIPNDKHILTKVVILFSLRFNQPKK